MKLIKHLQDLNGANGLQWVKLTQKEFLATKEIREVLTLLLGIDLILNEAMADVYYTQQSIVIRYKNGRGTIHSGIKPRSIYKT